jgi:hypothetical protein
MPSPCGHAAALTTVRMVGRRKSEQPREQPETAREEAKPRRVDSACKNLCDPLQHGYALARAAGGLIGCVIVSSASRSESARHTL